MWKLNGSSKRRFPSGRGPSATSPEPEPTKVRRPRLVQTFDQSVRGDCGDPELIDNLSHGLSPVEGALVSLPRGEQERFVQCGGQPQLLAGSCQSVGKARGEQVEDSVAPQSTTAAATFAGRTGQDEHGSASRYWRWR